MPKPQDDNLRLIALQALLPGLKTAQQVINDYVRSLENLLGVPQQQVGPPPAETPELVLDDIDDREATGSYPRDPAYRSRMSEIRKEYWQKLTPRKRKGLLKKMSDARETKAKVNGRTPRSKQSLSPSQVFLMGYMRNKENQLSLDTLRADTGALKMLGRAEGWVTSGIYQDLNGLIARGLIKKEAPGLFTFTAKGTKWVSPAEKKAAKE